MTTPFGSSHELMNGYRELRIDYHLARQVATAPEQSGKPLSLRITDALQHLTEPAATATKQTGKPLLVPSADASQHVHTMSTPSVSSHELMNGYAEVPIDYHLARQAATATKQNGKPLLVWLTNALQHLTKPAATASEQRCKPLLVRFTDALHLSCMKTYIGLNCMKTPTDQVIFGTRTTHDRTDSGNSKCSSADHRCVDDPRMMNHRTDSGNSKCSSADQQCFDETEKSGTDTMASPGSPARSSSPLRLEVLELPFDDESESLCFESSAGESDRSTKTCTDEVVVIEPRIPNARTDSCNIKCPSTDQCCFDETEKLGTDTKASPSSPARSRNPFRLDVLDGIIQNTIYNSPARSRSLGVFELPYDDESKSQISESTAGGTDLSVRHSVYYKKHSILKDKLDGKMNSRKSLLWYKYSPLAKDVVPTPSNEEQQPQDAAIPLPETEELQPPRRALRAPTPPDSESVSTMENSLWLRTSSIPQLVRRHDDARNRKARGGDDGSVDSSSATCTARSMYTGWMPHASPVAHGDLSETEKQRHEAAFTALVSAAKDVASASTSATMDPGETALITHLMELERSFQANYLLKGPLRACDEADEAHDEELEETVYLPIY